MRFLITLLFVSAIALSFGFIKKHPVNDAKRIQIQDTVGIKEKSSVLNTNSSRPVPGTQLSIVDPASFVAYAKTFIGTPYLYGSTDPAKGFDCSGFVNYVSHHFGLKVPRSSVEFTNYGLTVDRLSARQGDLILFTGTDTSNRIVGHIGIVTENNNGNIMFILYSSGKAKGVTVSGLEGYYETRFVKVIRIFS
jgi:cell wall-associated NlpC family hydrolase